MFINVAATHLRSKHLQELPSPEFPLTCKKAQENKAVVSSVIDHVLEDAFGPAKRTFSSRVGRTHLVQVVYTTFSFVVAQNNVITLLHYKPLLQAL